jgi:hypothetical protein
MRPTQYRRCALVRDRFRRSRKVGNKVGNVYRSETRSQDDNRRYMEEVELFRVYDAGSDNDKSGSQYVADSRNKSQ